MTGAELLKRVAGLSVPERMRVLSEEGRGLAGGPEFGRVLAELSVGGVYERRVAIHLAFVAGARDYLVGWLDSGDQQCVGRALTVAVRLGVEPAVIVERLPRLSQRNRKRLYRALARNSRESLADSLLLPLRALFGDAEAARVLPSCSTAVVAAHLPELGYAVPSWPALCRRHIGVVFDYVEAGAADARAADWRELWWWLTASPIAAAGHDAQRLLALAAHAIEHTSLSTLRPVAGFLARRDPAAVLALILHPSGNGRGLVGPATWRALGVLSDDRLRELFAASAPGDRGRLLRTVSPSRRTLLARPLLTRPGTAPADVDLSLLDLLPAEDRTAVARELLARPGGSDVPDVADALSARLPWGEAKSVLAEAIRLPAADDRARAYALMVRAAAGSRDAATVGELLALLQRLRNEQDPVRRTALHALTTIPVSLLSADALPALEQLCIDAVQARDRSHPTASAVEKLARTLLLRGAQTGEIAFTDTALRVATLLAEQSAFMNLYGLHRNLPRGAEHRLFTALRSRLENDAARDNWALVLNLADGLEHRARTVPELQQLVLRACGARKDSTVRHAVRLALDNPATRDAHLDAILRRDRSLITLPEVRRLVAHRRTDLLDALLGAVTPGRFLSTRIRFIPMFGAGFERWTPRQTERYARLLDGYARSGQVGIGDRTTAVRQLGLLPGSFEYLRPHIDAPDLSVAEAALTALGRSDEPRRAIAVLAEHVGNDRARVAVSSIACCARSIPPGDLTETIAPLLDSPKITAMKEGVRLLAVLHAPDAMTVIDALWARTDLHRDIRRAAVSATRWLFDHDEAWDLLTTAAQDPDVAGAILDIAPSSLPVPQRRRFAAFLRDLAAHADHRVAAQALAALPYWTRWWPTGTGAVLADRATDLTEVGLWRTAIRALLDGLTSIGDPTALIATVERLQSADSAVPGRDLPARQRLSTLLHWLAAALRQHDTARPAAAPIIDRLTADPLWHEQVIELTLAAVRWTEPEQTVRAIEALSAVATGALTDHPARCLAQRLTRDIDRTLPPALVTIATGLAHSTGSAAALAAVTLISACGARFGWAPPWLDLLGGLRTHTDIDVRRAALSVYTAPE
ncbi:hypothetical protein IU500_03965 [Nocardia terpenica]|uniref:hypothetical protein n=1 Tax=Nocardia terpenica TaxID=455432 RepID=UPI001895E49C|nr:hypothetical protein [Nocardia terpenica]MBF6059261.1 hypothetical protein [Nocardia terpenica]MBF6103200.1 hypothetical protein [Nocardia terpenica]MBF6110611.1 hypothetical protein [Nocardia terpenica]MBF6116742.1 hypothetical protein [Nocardia terpenica]